MPKVVKLTNTGTSGFPKLTTFANLESRNKTEHVSFPAWPRVLFPRPAGYYACRIMNLLHFSSVNVLIQILNDPWKKYISATLVQTYFITTRVLRFSIFSFSWNSNRCRNHSIFGSPSSLPNPLHKCSRRSGRVNFWWPLKTLNGLFRGKTWGDYLKSWRLIGGRETWDWNDGAVKFVANMKSGIKRYLTLNNKEKTFQIYNGWRGQGWGRRKRITPWRRWRRSRRWRTSQTAKTQHWQVFLTLMVM